MDSLIFNSVETPPEPIGSGGVSSELVSGL